MALKGVHQIVLGDSLLPGRSHESFHGLRFNFQPGTIDHARPGAITCGGADGDELSLSLPSLDTAGIASMSNAASGQGDHLYKGTRQQLKDVDCVLIYDEETNTYTLERLASMTRLEHQRTKSSRPSAVDLGRGAQRRLGAGEDGEGTPTVSAAASPNPSVGRASHPATPALGYDSAEESSFDRSGAHTGSAAVKVKRSDVHTNPPPRMSEIARGRPSPSPVPSAGTATAASAGAKKRRREPLAEDLDLSAPESSPPPSAPPAKKKSLTSASAIEASVNGRMATTAGAKQRTTRNSVTKATATLSSAQSSSSTASKATGGADSDIGSRPREPPVAGKRGKPAAQSSTSATRRAKSPQSLPALAPVATPRMQAEDFDDGVDGDDEEEDPDLDEFATMLESTLGQAEDFASTSTGGAAHRPSSAGVGRPSSAGLTNADESSEDED